MAGKPHAEIGTVPPHEWVLVRLQRVASGGRVQETRSIRVWDMPIDQTYGVVLDALTAAVRKATEPAPIRAPKKRRAE